MSLYYSTNYLLVLAILISSYVPNSPKVIIAASTVTAGTAAFGSMLLTWYFSNCRNCGSDCVIGCGM